MEGNIYALLADSIGVSIPILFVILIWSLVWKAIALWKSARNTHLVWFILFLLVHTVGILEILYLFVFSKMRFDGKPKKQTLKIKKSHKKKKR
jgi:methionyl-tRNA synthetase